MHRKPLTLIVPVSLVLTVVLLFGFTLTRAQERQQTLESTAVGSAFTYQGRLNDGGIPADGSYDFQFGLYVAPIIGSQIGITVPQTIMVNDGLFTTVLDFGLDVFNGEPRYLEIAVKLSGGGGYTTLTPRQPFTAVPYASYADKVQPVENIVVVAKSGGDYTSIQDALDNITASANNPYLIRVAPGIYTETVALKSYVDIEGSGEGMTILRGTGGSDFSSSMATLSASGIITAEVRSLTVESDGTGENYGNAIWTSGTNAALRLTHITAIASGGSGNNFGVTNFASSSPSMDNITISALGGGNNSGIYNLSASSPTLDNVTATASGGSNSNSGITNDSSSPTMNNVTVTAVGGLQSNGITNSNASSPMMNHVIAIASGGSTFNAGVNNASSSSPIMSNVTASGSGGTQNYGIFNNSSSTTMDNVTATGSGGTESYGVYTNSLLTIRDSALSGATNSIINAGGSSPMIAYTMLEGAADSGIGLTCIGAYTSAFVALNANCE